MSHDPSSPSDAADHRPDDVVHEYAFDVKMFAVIEVKATSEAQARQLVSDLIDNHTANLGCWPKGEPNNGDPVVVDLVIDGRPDLNEIDGEAPE